VIATARDPRTLAGLPADQRLALDVTDPDTIASAVQEAGQVDVLVSNAGEIFYAAVEATPPRAFARLLDLSQPDDNAGRGRSRDSRRGRGAPASPADPPRADR
jgi:hypothetical protein